MSTEKLEIGGTLTLEAVTYENLPTDVSFNFVEHSPDHWHSDRDTDVSIDKDMAVKIVAMLTKHFDLVGSLEAEVERLTSEAMYCSEYSEPEDLMFERLERAARTSFRKHKSSIRGQQITRADSYESHLVWAAQQEMKAQLAAAQGQCDTITELNHAQWLALENVRMLAARNRKEEWAQHLTRFCNEAGNVNQILRAAPIPQQPSMPEGWKQAVALAYGHLWHVNNEPMAPIPLRSSETAAYEARKQLRDLLTHEERGIAINQVQVMLAAAPQPKETK